MRFLSMWTRVRRYRDRWHQVKPSKMSEKARRSGGFLVAFAAVNFAAFRLSVTIDVARWIPVLGSALRLIAIVVLFSQVGRLERILFGLMIAVSVAIETIAQLQERGMHIRHRPS